MQYKLGSLFDGSGGFPLAGALCGVEPVWAAEIEPYPIAVTRSRFPNMKHLGDISKIHGGEIEPVDIITFGSPCQDLSVAGKRAGLKHEANGDEETTRSGLFMEAVRIIKEMREATNGKYPTFALWENVPGAFSSNKGEDFRIVCEELIKIVEPAASMPAVPKGGWAYSDSYVGDGWSLAYRVFDAQHWGVPQRRRRIHLVTDFSGQRAREVLFEREGVRGYFAQGTTPWQAAPADAQGSTGADDRAGEGFDGYNGDLTGGVSSTLGVNCGVSTGRNGVVERGRQLDAVTLEPGIAAREGGHIYEGVSGTLRANAGDNQMAVAIPYTLKIRGGVEVDSAGKAAGKGALIQTNLSATLGTSQDQYLFEPVYAIENHPADSRVDIEEGGTVQTLTSRMGTGGGNVPMVMEPKVFESHPMDSRVKEVGDIGPTVTTKYAKGGVDTPLVMEPFCKSARAQSKDDATTWKPGRVANTLNTFDQGETRANELVVQSEPVICLQGNGIDRADNAGCNGKGWNDEACYTLNTIDRPAVVYAVDQGAGKSGANVSENQAPTLCTTHGGEPAIAYQDSVGALCARDYKGVGSQYVSEDKLVVEEALPIRYIVRRLTPTECARLQGFADWWGIVEQKDSLTDEEYQFWHEARNTHAAINGKKVQDYTEKQMLTWYNKLYTDSAEYKMWGNGIALPPALYCLQGIVDALNKPEDDLDDWMM